MKNSYVKYTVIGLVGLFPVVAAPAYAACPSANEDNNKMCEISYGIGSTFYSESEGRDCILSASIPGETCTLGCIDPEGKKRPDLLGVCFPKDGGIVGEVGLLAPTGGSKPASNSGVSKSSFSNAGVSGNSDAGGATRGNSKPSADGSFDLDE